jgi:phage-related tail protein
MPLERHIVELSARDNLSPTLKRVGQAAEDTGRKGTRSAADWGRAATALGATLGGTIGVMAKL